MICQIEAIYPLTNTVNGNPRFAFALVDMEGDFHSHISMSDAAYCYAVGNPDMRVGSTVDIELTRAGRIRHMNPHKEN